MQYCTYCFKKQITELFTFNTLVHSISYKKRIYKNQKDGFHIHVCMFVTVCCDNTSPEFGMLSFTCFCLNFIKMG